MRDGLKSLLIACVAVAAGALLRPAAAPVPVSADERLVQGGGEGGLVEERIRYKTESGTTQSVNLRRVLVKVPRAYGSLVQATGTAHGSVLWFQSPEGALRNVVLNDAGALYHVEYEQ